MVQVIGDKYPTNIPALSDNADIQTALKVYHYGQASEPSSLLANSVAGHLNTLENTKVDIVPIQITSGAGNDLNTKNITGYYSVSTNSIASAGANYPSGATAGMLTVINDGSGIIYQTYQSNNSKLYWRGFFAGGWSTWTEASPSTHTHTEFTTLAGSIATKQNIITGAASTVADTNLDASRVVVSDGSGKIRASADITVTELGYLNGATSQVQTVILGNKASATPIPTGMKRMIIARDSGSNAPDATVTPVEGDLWFW
jgi:hypothetical protein